MPAGHTRQSLPVVSVAFSSKPIALVFSFLLLLLLIVIILLIVNKVNTKANPHFDFFFVCHFRYHVRHRTHALTHLPQALAHAADILGRLSWWTIRIRCRRFACRDSLRCSTTIKRYGRSTSNSESIRTNSTDRRPAINGNGSTIDRTRRRCFNPWIPPPIRYSCTLDRVDLNLSAISRSLF